MVLQREDVAAGALAPAAERTLRLRVIRPFQWEGEIRGVDEVLTVPYRDGRALVTYGKAEPAPEPEADPSDEGEED